MGEPVVKVMKRIRPRCTAVEACVTRHGTIVAPMMTELVGFEELTPYKGGWCGNEIFADPFDRSVRDKTRRMTYAIGERLKEEGYRGYFELDFLIDEDTGHVYLGELNPRITGASSITNHAVFALSDMPLFLFHLLEWMDVDYELERPADKPALGQAREHRHLEPARDQAHRRHRRGRDRGPADRHLADGRRGPESASPASTPTAGPSRARREAFFLRITGVGDYWYEGADLGILVTRGRLMTDDFELNERARAWISGIKSRFEAVEPSEADGGTRPAPSPLKAHPAPGSFKIL